MDNDPIIGYVFDLDIVIDFNAFGVGDNHAFLDQLIDFMSIGIHRSPVFCSAGRLLNQHNLALVNIFFHQYIHGVFRGGKSRNQYFIKGYGIECIK